MEAVFVSTAVFWVSACHSSGGWLVLTRVPYDSLVSTARHISSLSCVCVFALVFASFDTHVIVVVAIKSGETTSWGHLVPKLGVSDCKQAPSVPWTYGCKQSSLLDKGSGRFQTRHVFHRDGIRCAGWRKGVHSMSLVNTKRDKSGKV